MTTKVIVIVGSQRGGTTVLGRLLGEVDGFTFGGELRDVWDKGVEVACGCGLDQGECPVWSALLTGDGLAEVSPAQVAAWRDQAVPDRHSWLSAWRLQRSSPGQESVSVDLYGDAMGRLYQAIAGVTGAQVVIDSSKHPNDAVLAGRLPCVDAYLLHVVRDPRGSAYSVVRRHRGQGRSSLGLLSDTGHTTLQWLTRHLVAEWVGRSMGPGRYLRVRYEDLVTAPAATVEQISAWVGEAQRRPPDIDDGWVDFDVAHTTGGRGRLGPTRLRLEHDTAWTTELSRPAALLTVVLSWPLMRRYGYRAAPAQASSGPGG